MDELINEAKGIINLRYKKGSHSVGAAIRTASGKIYTGVSINAQKLDLCAEWAAFGKALSEGDPEIQMIVAIHRKENGETEFYPPCALCRELFITYCPDAEVILSENQTVKAKDLLPNAWKKKNTRP